MGVLNSFASPEGNARAIMEVRRYNIFEGMVKSIDPEVAENMKSYKILGYDTLFEWVLAALCNITWTDVKGKDFSNNMDLKCRTILKNNTNGSFAVKVNSLNNKVGDIVVVVYDATSEQFRFFLMPYKEWRANYNPRSDKGYFNMSFPRYSAEYNWWNAHEVKDLYSLVKVIRKASK